MSAADLFALFALFAIVALSVLYSLVRSEVENAERTTREEARERVSREQDDHRR